MDNLLGGITHVIRVLLNGDLMCALFFGAIIASVLFGITILQAYIYFRTFQQDRWIHKISVAVLVLLDAVILAMTAGGAWVLINNINSYSSGGLFAVDVFVNTPFQNQAAITGIMISLQQTLYWYRIWCGMAKAILHTKLLAEFIVRNGARILPLCIAFFVCIGWAFTLAFALILLDIIPTSEQAIIGWVKSWSLITPFNDAAIAITLCYYLRRARYTNPRWITFLLKWLFGSGLLTSIFSIALPFAIFTTGLGTPIFLALDAVIPKLYVNSFLAMLNFRSLKEDQAAKAYKVPKDVPV